MIELDLKDPSVQGRQQDRLADSAGTSHEPSRKRGILVVDDEAAVRGVLNIWVRQQGFAVWVAAGGQEALDVYRLHHATIDVVLMDVRMPGLDGPETLVALQELNPRIRCCFMSGDLGGYTAEILQNLGAASVLQKPFDLAEVARLLCEQAIKAAPTSSSPIPCDPVAN